MIDTMTWVLAFLVGLALGAMFFGGLWWTVRKGVLSNRPALWFFTSLVLRMGLFLPAFYFAAAGRWERMVACLLGFLVARLVVTRLTRAPTDQPPASGKEVSHAP